MASVSTAPPAKPATRSLLCPFTIVVDTREQRPYTFAAVVSDARHAYRPWDVPLHGATLGQGDYSIQGKETEIAIERKSKADLFSTLGQGRARFGRELERLCGLEAAYVVVEAEWREVIGEPPPYSRLNPRTVHASIVAWQHRYRGIHWWFCPGRDFAERTTFRLLERFWRDLQEPRKVRAK